MVTAAVRGEAAGRAGFASSDSQVAGGTKQVHDSHDCSAERVTASDGTAWLEPVTGEQYVAALGTVDG